MLCFVYWKCVCATMQVRVTNMDGYALVALGSCVGCFKRTKGQPCSIAVNIEL